MREPRHPRPAHQNIESGVIRQAPAKSSKPTPKSINNAPKAATGHALEDYLRRDVCGAKARLLWLACTFAQLRKPTPPRI
jgi:hypothetical protein